MKQAQRGFTLIELVMVIVILGVLAAVAIPKFVDLSDEAKVAALKGIAGAAGSASAINYASCSAVGNIPGAKCVTISTCVGVATILQGGFAGAASTATDPGSTNGASSTCTITKDGKSDTFVAIAAGN
jgi:MSHA pilin protein MshA